MLYPRVVSSTPRAIDDDGFEGRGSAIAERLEQFNNEQPKAGSMESAGRTSGGIPTMPSWKLKDSVSKSASKVKAEAVKRMTGMVVGGKPISTNITFEDLLHEKKEEAKTSYWGIVGNATLLVSYFLVGALVFSNVEERPCDDQPSAAMLKNVTITYNGETYTNADFVQIVPQCMQKWTILDSIYFSIVTLTTVGYGDLAPQTDTGRIFGFFYVLFGLGVVFNIIRKAIDGVTESLRQKTNNIFEHEAGDANIYLEYISKVTLWTAVIIGFVVGGGAIYALLEGWTMLEGTWWAFITTLTVGFGDLEIETDAAKIFTIVYILITVITVATAVGKISNARAELAQEAKRRALLNTGLNGALIAGLDEDGDGVDRYEFVIGMLKILDVITEDQVTPWSRRFDALDADGSGKLDREDLEKLEKELRGPTAPTAKPKMRGGGETKRRIIMPSFSRKAFGGNSDPRSVAPSPNPSPNANPNPDPNPNPTNPNPKGSGLGSRFLPSAYCVPRVPSGPRR